MKWTKLLKSSELVDLNGKAPKPGMVLYKPMIHNMFRGDAQLELFNVKERHSRDGSTKLFLTSVNWGGLITKGISHVKGGILFDTFEEANEYRRAQMTPKQRDEEDKYNTMSDDEKVKYRLNKMFDE